MAEAGGSIPTRPSDPLGRPSFRRLWVANLLSTSGTVIGNTALLWLVFTRTHNPLAISLMGVAGFLPAILFGVFAGALADRYDRRRLMIVADLSRAACVAAIPISWWLIGFSLLLLLAVVFVLEGFSALFRPAANALLPTLVSPDEVDAATAYMQGGNSIAVAVGSGAAGLLIVAVGVVAGLAYNSATFVVSALLISLLVVSGPSGRTAESGRVNRSIGADIREGMRFLRGQRGLLLGTVAATFINFFMTMVVQFLVIYATAGLELGAAGFGFLIASFSLGFLLGALAASRLHLGRRLGKTLAVTCIATGAVISGLAYPTFPEVALFLLGSMGALLGLLVTTFYASVQRIVPNELLGRYFSLDEVGSLTAVPIAQVAGGLFILAIGVRETYLIAGLGMAVVGLAVLASPSLRRLNDSPAIWPAPVTPVSVSLTRRN